MDSNALNKILGVAIGSLLVFLLLGFFSRQIYYGMGDHGHEQVLAFALDTGEDEQEAAEEEAAPVSLAALVADADVEAGAQVWNQCRACHKIEDGANGVGPHLWNVMGREIASVEGFNYSDALSSKEGVWELENMSAWLENPSEWAPGTSMGYAGLSDPADRVNVIAYINAQSGEQVDLAALAPEEPPAEAEAAAETGGGDGAAEAGGGEDMASAAASGGGEDGGGQYAALLANASAENGAKVWNQCRACHKLEDGVNGVGPHLYGVVGREIASVGDYSYSDALSSKEGVWDLDTLMRWLGAPGEFAPGNKMGYALTDEQDRIDVITYMNEEGPEPIELGAAGGDGGTQQAAADESATDTAAAGEAAGDAAGGDDTAAAEETAGADDQAASGEASGSGDQAAADTGGDGSEMAAADATADAPSGGDGPWAAELAAADAEAGQKVFNRCRACHKVEDGANGVGPHLHDVIGREIAGVDGYSYSDALASIDGVWDLETMMTWLEKPGEFAPGNKMGFALRDAQDRVNVITYLNEVDGSPAPLQ